MAKERLQRRLAAILSADVVGYSRLMGVDEAGTLSRLKALRRSLIEPTIATYSGRIVKLMGDGALVEFASAVDAVTCAIEIQTQLRERQDSDEANSIRFRIGINVGDIIIEGDDILGDGVNIAARIEGIAEPGGISISEDAWRQVQGKVTADFVDAGEQSLKNIAKPVRVYRVKPEEPHLSGPSATSPAAGTRTDLTRPQLSPGTRLNGIFEIDQPIGVGGMGEIYKGHLIETGDPVAIKVMLPEFSENEAAFTLFRKEASALHYIQHDAVVRYYVFTVEPELRRPYLAMEFVDGNTLTEILQRDGPLSTEAVARLLHRLASGLQAAHSHGIVHRDVSPDNIIIPNGGVTRAKIIDFGIARTTRHGTVIAGGFAGKFSYVSPEQLGLFGGEVTAKSDIYSLGLVAAEALTAKPLDMGGSQVEIIEKRRRVPDLGAIDLRFHPLLQRMLQPDPGDRPDSMAAVAASVVELAPDGLDSNLLTGRKTEAARFAPQREFRSRSLPKTAAAGLLLLALVGGGGGLLYFYAPRTPTTPSADLGKGAPESPPAPPVLSPPAESKSHAEPEGNAPTSLPATQAALPETGKTPPEASPPLLARPAVEAIRSYIEQYDGGNCFFVAPITISEHAAAIEGFGASLEPFRAFDTAFQRSLGFEADIGVREVTEQQCPALTFLYQLRGAKARPPHLDIDRDALRDGDVLNGMVDHYGSRQVALLLVSDSGTVQNVSSLLKPGTDAKTFNIGMKRADGAAGRQPQLLIAVASSSAVPALQPGEPSKANEFFGRVLSEAAKSPASMSATARYFILEK
jgi:class 3 adenylate cyclase/serine/threonine protein kinase